MELLEIEEMVGIPSPYITQLTPFKEIIQRDESEGRRIAAMELAYIHFMVHHNSDYQSWDPEIRPQKVKKDIFGEDSEWQPDDLVSKGMDKYKELISSEHTRMLDAARRAANTLIKHFDNLVIEDPKDAKDVISNLSKVGDVVEGIDKLKERIEKDEANKNDNRAGVKTNKYSEG